MHYAYRGRLMTVFLLALTLAGPVTTRLTASMAPPSLWRVEPSEEDARVTLLAEDRDVFHYVPPPQRSAGTRAQTANIHVNYLANETNYWGSQCDPWDPSAQAAFDYAVGIWEMLLTSAVTIEINACWTDDLAGNVLGGAAPRSMALHASSGTWYPVALANALTGYDIDPGVADIEAEFNSIFAWYYGTDGNTPSGKVDFVSVVLHEVCHGLGFTGSMHVSGGQGSWGSGSPFPFIYDRFTENGSGQALLNTALFPNHSAALAAQLTSNNVYFDGPDATAANGGTPAKLYAPSTWAPGSSYSHLDEVYNGTANSLMTYSLGSAESEHSPGPVTLGILRDLGWVTIEDWPDLSVVKRVVGTPTPLPGDPITFTLSIENVGTDTAASVTVSDTLSGDIQSPSWSTSFSGVSVIGGPYVWELPDLEAGAAGVITVTGIINPGLPSGFSIWNTVEIDTSTFEPVTDNNQSTALVGGYYLALPFLVQRVQ